MKEKLQKEQNKDKELESARNTDSQNNVMDLLIDLDIKSEPQPPIG